MSMKAGFWKNEDGQSMVEYALIIALVAIVCVVGLILVGKALLGSYGDSKNKILEAFSQE